MEARRLGTLLRGNRSDFDVSARSESGNAANRNSIRSFSNKTGRAGKSDSGFRHGLRRRARRAKVFDECSARQSRPALYHRPELDCRPEAMNNGEQRPALRRGPKIEWELPK